MKQIEDMKQLEQYDEEVKHRGYKKKKRTKKSDHKHDYEDVIGITTVNEKKRAYPYKICRICNKAEMSYIFFTAPGEDRPSYMVLGNLESAKKLRPDLRVVDIDELKKEGEK